MRKLTPALLGLVSVLCAACALPQRGNERIQTGSGGVMTHTGSDTDIGAEAMPEDIDSMEIESPTITLSVHRETGAIVVGTGSLPALTIVSDIGCFYCREFSVKDLSWVEEEYAAHGKLAIKHVFLPMDTVGKYMAQIAVCAQEQGKFRETMEALTTTPVATDTQMQTLTKKLGLSAVSMRRCISSTPTKKLLDAMKKDADALNITRVPMFFIGDMKWLGVETRETLKKNIDAAIR